MLVIPITFLFGKEAKERRRELENPTPWVRGRDEPPRLGALEEACIGRHSGKTCSGKEGVPRPVRLAPLRAVVTIWDQS